MNKDLERVVEIPEGVEVVVSGNEVCVKKGENELKRKFDVGKIQCRLQDEGGKKQVILSAKGASKREAKMMGTIWAHLKNMIKGVGEDFVYELEVCNVHFPMNVAVQDAQQLAVGSKKLAVGKVVIKSFLGERTERVAKVLAGVKIDISGNKISVTSHDIEAAGQTAANLEKATRLTGRDRRIFQDGIFITKKPWRVI